MNSVAPEVADRIQRLNLQAWWDRVALYSYDAVLAVFALACAGLLVVVFLPQESEAVIAYARGDCGAWKLRLCRIRWRIGSALIALLCGIGAAGHQTSIDQQRGFIADQEKRFEASIKKLSAREGSQAAFNAQYMYMPTGSSLAYLTLGNTAVAADFVWLTSLQYVSSAFRRGQKFELLERFYDTILDLQPEWRGAIASGGKVLSALSRDRNQVDRFYSRAIIRNPRDWYLCYEAGRVFFVPPQTLEMQEDYARRAVAWFERARTKPNFPPGALAQVNDLIARFSLESGGEEYLKAAAEIMYNNATNPDQPYAVRDIASADWLRAHSMWQQKFLQNRVHEWKQKRGQFPPKLDALLETLPKQGAAFREDAYGFAIEYDAEKGSVGSRGLNAYRSIHAAHVVTEHTEIFKAEHARFPKTLAELREFVREMYKPPHQPASSLVIEAFGMSLDPENGPLGPWDYDAKSGRVILPEIAKPAVLFRKAEELLKRSGAVKPQ